MRSRFVPALLAALALAGAAAAEPPKPAVVIQTQPVARVLSDVKEIARQVAGPGGDAAAKEFEKDLKEALGEKGFDGLDINRPVVAYAVLKDKVEDCGLVAVVPVTAEKDFVAFLERIHIKAEAADGKKGVYELDLPNDDLFPKGSHLQFVPGGWAYLTFNDGDPTDPKDFVAVGDLLANADTALASVRVYPGRLPPKLVAAGLDGIDQAAAGFKMFLGGGGVGPVEKSMAALFDEGPKLARRYAETAMKEADEVRLSFGFDPTGGDGQVELVVVPKAGTALAKELAAVVPTQNRFAALVTKDAAAVALFKAPLFAKELREIAGAQYEGLGDEVKNAPLPEKLRPVAAEALKGVGRALKAGRGDCAVVLNGPDAGGKFTVVAALPFDDPAAVEKAVRELAKDADLGKEVELDAAKAGGAGVHKVPLYRIFPEESREGLAKVFGDKPPGAVAFAKDAVVMAFGPGAVDAVKAALESKPAAAPAVDVTTNMARLQKLLAATDPKAGEQFAKFMGTTDKPVSAFRLTVAGGDRLTVKATVNVQILPRLVLAGETSNQTFEKVGEAVKP